MQKGFQLNIKSILGIILLLVLLVSVRLFQESLFYDPLIPFFKTEADVLPPYEPANLFLGLLLRYTINTVLSLAILYLVFKEFAVVRVSAVLYGIFFIVLVAAFFLVVSMARPNLMLLFYIRRFLIQPLFLILFVPAFYYQKKMK
jgi:exosortase F-associated protein